MGYRIQIGTDQIDKDEWAKFINNHPNGSVFQSPNMYEVYKHTNNYEPIILFALEENHILGILLGVIQKEPIPFISQLTSRSIIWGGPLFYDHFIGDSLLYEYDKQVRGEVIYSQIRNISLLDSLQKTTFEKNGFTFKDHLNIFLNLSMSEEEFWKGIKPSRKHGINKARKQNFRFKVTSKPEYLNDFCLLLKESYKKTGLPFPDKSFFLSLSKNLSDEIKWFILIKENVPIIILVALKHKGIIHALYIGITNKPTLLNLRPVDLFFYEVMIWGIRNGLETFDWMGAGKPDKEYGVRKFKIQYGGNLINLGRYEKIHKPILMKIGRLGLKIWKLK